MKSRNFIRALPGLLALALVWFTSTCFVVPRALLGPRSFLHRRVVAEATSTMSDSASDTEEEEEKASFPKAFAFLNVLNVPLALTEFPALAVAVPLTAVLAMASTQKPDGRPFEKAIEESSLDSLTITSPSNRLVRACLGALHVLVGVRCAARCAKSSLLWSGISLLQVIAVFVVGGIWLSTSAHGQ